MENDGSSSSKTLLAFLNILTAELQLEEIESVDDTRNLLPILVNLIKTGELTFVSEYACKFSNIFDFIREQLAAAACEGLQPESADQGNEQEMSNIILALLFILRLKQESKFHKLCDNLDETNRSRLLAMIEALEQFDRQQAALPFGQAAGSASPLLSMKGKRNSSLSSGIQIYSSHSATGAGEEWEELLMEHQEDLTKYKVKATELEAKLKQVESLNATLNEQLGVVQTEYSDLENRYEKLKQKHALNQETQEHLQAQLKETADETETLRYQNSQLDRDLNQANDRLARTGQKSSTELKAKEEECRILYTRLDELVQQVTVKESLENNVRLLEQQRDNLQGILKELREERDAALARVNTAEVEVARFQTKRHNSGISNSTYCAVLSNGSNDDDKKQQESADDKAAGLLSLHDELNSNSTDEAPNSTNIITIAYEEVQNSACETNISANSNDANEAQNSTNAYDAAANSTNTYETENSSTITNACEITTNKRSLPRWLVCCCPVFLMCLLLLFWYAELSLEITYTR